MALNQHYAQLVSRQLSGQSEVDSEPKEIIVNREVIVPHQVIVEKVVEKDKIVGKSGQGAYDSL